MANIDNLSIQISSSAGSAAKGIDTLVTQLGKLKSAVSTSGDGLDRVSHQLTDIGNAGRGMSNNIAQKLTNLANGLKALQSVGKVTISSTIGKGIESINQALNSLNVNNLPKIERFANALKALSGMGDIRISSTIAKEMTNIGAAAELLKDVDFTGVKNLADALKQFQGMQDVKIPKISGGAAAAAAAAAAEAAGAADVVEDTMDSVPPSEVEAENSTRSFGDALKGLAQKLNGAIGPVNGFKGTVKGLWGVLKGAVGGVLGFVGGIARIAKYRFIRALIKDLVQSFKDLYGYSDKFGTGFADAMDKITTSTTYFRNSLAAMVAPLVEMLAPALDFIIDKVVDVLNWFNQLFAALSGSSTYTAARKVERAWSSTFNNTTNSARQAQKELKRTILGFDEINKLNDNTNHSSHGRTGHSPYSNGYQLMFEERPIESGFTGFSNAIENAMEGMLSRITMIVSGASLALGAILLFSGVNPPLGLSLMVAGASGLASIIGMNWNGLSAEVKLVIGAIETALGGALLAIGAILAFSGTNIPLGIAMMVAGAASIAAAVGLNWDLITGKVRVSARGVAGAISAASLALGAILAFTGVNVPLGIGLMVAGATGVIATIQWDYLKNKLNGPIGKITAMISAALLMLGFIALAAGRVPLGIGLFVAGSAGLATTIAARWDRLKEYMEGPIGNMTLVLSAATLILGFIAIAAGRIPLGVGLLVAGSAGIAITLAARWDRLKEYIEGPVGDIVTFISVATLMLGIVAIAAGRIPLGVGLLVAGSAGIAITIAARWNRLQEYIEGPLSTITGILGAASLVLGFVAISAGRIPLGVGLLVAGAAGLTVTLAARWNRLQEYLDGPIGDITLAISAATLMLGFVAIVAGRIPLGVGLLVAGAIGITATLPARWDRLQGYMEGPIGDLTLMIGGATLVLGMAAIAAGRIMLGVGLLVAGAAAFGTALAARWDRLQGYIDEPLTNLMTLIGGATLVLGMVALAAGRVMLGVGLLVAGAVAIGGALAARWNRLQEYIEGPLSDMMTIVGAATLVLGFVAFSAGRIMLGVGLLVAGATAIGGALAARWDRMKEYLETPINAIMELIAAASLMLGFVALAAGKIMLGVGLLVAGSVGLADSLNANWNILEDKIGVPLSKILAIIEGAELVLGILALVAGKIPLGLGLILSGAAGLAKNISENWDSLVQLGKDAVASVKEGWESGNFFSLIIHPLISDGEENPTLPGGVQANATQWFNDLDVGMLQRYIQTILDPGVDVDVRVMLIKDLWDTVNKWVYDNMGGKEIEAKVALVKQWFGGVLDSLGLSGLKTVVSVNAQTLWGYFGRSFLSWFNLDNLKTNVSVDGKTRWGENGKSFLSWFNLDNLKTNVNVDAFTPWQYWGRSFLSWIGADNLKTTVDVSYKASGGISRASNRNMTKAKGGVFSGTTWSEIPQYAGGTSSAHGSLFIAGEAGPEIVGHIGGTTEVLNKSQLAATMYSAVQAAMAPASANFAAAATQMYKGVDGMNGEDMETLMEMVRQTNDATMRQNELLREQNDYLRQLNDKDFTAEITTSGISRAQVRANRRAGTTVIPVGT